MENIVLNYCDDFVAGEAKPSHYHKKWIDNYIKNIENERDYIVNPPFSYLN